MSVDRVFALALPKIELHAHLTGSISRDSLHTIWLSRNAQDRGHVPLPDPLLALPAGKVDYDITTFFPLFSSYIYQLCSDLPTIEHSTKTVLHDFQADGVVYLELRTTPRAMPATGVTKEAYVQTILSVLTAHNATRSSMRAFLILSIDRRNTLAEAQEVVDLAIHFQSSGVVGIDLCGDPTKGDVRIFEPAFARARAAGLKLTLHFAEADASASDAELRTLLSWKPDRLGHVIHVKDEFHTRIQDDNIGVELCLSGNVHAKMIAGSYGDHHFGRWRHTNVPVALSTDDVGIFCSPLSNEYFLAAQHFGLDRKDIKALCTRAIDSIFAGPDEHARLQKIYADWDGWTED